MVELECPNLHCGRVFDTPESLSKHLNYCRCQQRSRLILKHSKKRKQGNKDDEVVIPPSVSTYRSNLEKKSRRKQDRGTSYNDSRYFNPTNKRNKKNKKNKEKTGQEDVVFDSSHTDDLLLAKEGGEEEEEGGGGGSDEEEGESKRANL